MGFYTFNINYPKLNKVVKEVNGDEVVSYELDNDKNNLKKYEQINELVDFVLDQFKEVADKIPYRTDDENPEKENTFPEAGLFVDAENYFNTMTAQVLRDLDTKINTLESEYKANPLKIQYDQKEAELKQHYDSQIEQNSESNYRGQLHNEYVEKKAKLKNARNKALDDEYHKKLDPLKRDVLFIRKAMSNQAQQDAIEPFKLQCVWELLQMAKEYKKITSKVPVDYQKAKKCWGIVKVGLSYYVKYNPSKEITGLLSGNPMALALNSALQHYNEYDDIDTDEVKLLMTIADKMGNVINKAEAFSERWGHIEKVHKDKDKKTTGQLVNELQADIDQYTQKAKQIFAEAKENGIDLYTVEAEWKKAFDREGVISAEIKNNSVAINTIETLANNAKNLEENIKKKESELKNLKLNSGLNINGLDGKNILSKENIDSIIKDLSSELEKKNKQFKLLGEAEKEEQELKIVKANALNKEENKKNQEKSLNALLRKEIEAKMYKNATREVAEYGLLDLKQCKSEGVDAWAKSLKDVVHDNTKARNDSLEAIKAGISFVQLLYADTHYKNEDEIAADSERLKAFENLIKDCKKYYGDTRNAERYESAKAQLLNEIKSANGRAYDAEKTINTEEFKKNKSLYEGYINKLNGELNATKQKITNAENVLNAKKEELPKDKEGKLITKEQLAEDIGKLSKISGEIQGLNGKRDLIADPNQARVLEERNRILQIELTPLQDRLGKLETAKNNKAALFNDYKSLLNKKTDVNKILHDERIRRKVQYLNQYRVADILTDFRRAKDHAMKEGHKNSNEFNSIIEKLNIAGIYFSGNKIPDHLRDLYIESQPIVIKELKEAAETYIRAKEAQWRPNPSTMRKQRLRYARSIKEFAATVLDDINKQKKDFDEFLSVTEKVNPDITEKTMFSHIRALNPKELGQYTDEFAKKEYVNLVKVNLDEKSELENVRENKKDAVVGKRPSLDDDNKADKKDDLNKSFSFN